MLIAYAIDFIPTVSMIPQVRRCFAPKLPYDYYYIRISGRQNRQKRRFWAKNGDFVQKSVGSMCITTPTFTQNAEKNFLKFFYKPLKNGYFPPALVLFELFFQDCKVVVPTLNDPLFAGFISWSIA